MIINPLFPVIVYIKKTLNSRFGDLHVDYFIKSNLTISSPYSDPMFSVPSKIILVSMKTIVPEFTQKEHNFGVSSDTVLYLNLSGMT